MRTEIMINEVLNETGAEMIIHDSRKELKIELLNYYINDTMQCEIKIYEFGTTELLFEISLPFKLFRAYRDGIKEQMDYII